ncbi:MAG: tRNA pseudouridine(55) synthase TruB [Clostridia bacterium]|nr:tRNA pseudouridine(55) synthase TruB [Clostridia bacterium]
MKDGIILINKPQGITSFSAVAKVRRALNVKCGHSGTLDPIATGLLPVMCGKATKLCSYLTDGDKAYRAALRFGIETDTHDITGNVTKTCEKAVTLEQIREILPRFIGKIRQVPPAYSAIKVGGRALYKLAREGKCAEIPEREITVYSIETVDFSGKELIMDIECSKGTYIRSLCRDIARALGTVGTMSALVRTKTCGWTVEDAVSPESDELERHIISMDDALSAFPEFYPEPFFARLLSNGCAVSAGKLKGLPDGLCRVYSDRLLGLGNTLKTDQGMVFKLLTHL